MKVSTMRLLAISLFLALFLSISPLSAQELFIQKHERQTPAPTPEPAPAPAPTTPGQNAETAQDETLVSKDLANQYYNNCLQKEDATMSADTQKSLCACTAAKMSETMSVEEIQTMSLNTEEGAYQRSRMTALVYVPCMEYPLRDLVYNNCASNSEVTKEFKKHKAVCSCLAGNMAKFYAEQGMQIVNAEIMKQSPAGTGIATSLNAFMGSSLFHQKSQYYSLACIQKYGM